jgi:phage tail-like protein
MPIAESAMLGLVNRFHVKVTPGDHDLGSWSKVDGLDVTFEVPEYRAGDAWNFRWFFAGSTKYSNVKLSRAAVSKDTPHVHDWLSDIAKKGKPGEVTIELRDAHHEPVHSWTLKNAMPVKWNISGFEAGGSQVAVESLEIGHIGFLDDEVKG